MIFSYDSASRQYHVNYFSGAVPVKHLVLNKRLKPLYQVSLINNKLNWQTSGTDYGEVSDGIGIHYRDFSRNTITGIVLSNYRILKSNWSGTDYIEQGKVSSIPNNSITDLLSQCELVIPVKDSALKLYNKVRSLPDNLLSKTIDKDQLKPLTDSSTDIPLNEIIYYYADSQKGTIKYYDVARSFGLVETYGERRGYMRERRSFLVDRNKCSVSEMIYKISFRTNAALMK